MRKAAQLLQIQADKAGSGQESTHDRMEQGGFSKCHHRIAALSDKLSAPAAQGEDLCALCASVCVCM